MTDWVLRENICIYVCVCVCVCIYEGDLKRNAHVGNTA